MPAKSEAQRKAAGAALGAKRKGKKLPKNTPAGKMESMSDQSLSDFAKKPGGKKLPAKAPKGKVKTASGAKDQGASKLPVKPVMKYPPARKNVNPFKLARKSDNPQQGGGY
jgi:hypothetical protein